MAESFGYSFTIVEVRSDDILTEPENRSLKGGRLNSWSTSRNNSKAFSKSTGGCLQTARVVASAGRALDMRSQS
jgi:hypothetical protein